MIRFAFPVLLLAYFLHVNTVSSTNDLSKNTIHNCNNSEWRCLSCQTSQLCVWNVTTGMYDGNYVWNCTNGMTCYKGRCINNNPQCSINTTNPVGFECRTPGMYPDPFDCKKYHYCVPNSANNSTSNFTLIKYSAECDCHYAYNAFTKSCDVNLRNNTCDYYKPVSDCKEKGQSDRLWTNPSIYYICLPNYNREKLYPYLYGCDHGKAYNNRSYLCE